MRAKIEWVRPEDGGRSKPPSGLGSPPYATLVKLDGSNNPWPSPDAWSLIVEKVEASDPFTWEAEVKFLAHGAPVELLTPGRGFELYEGYRRVAVGTLK